MPNKASHLVVIASFMLFTGIKVIKPPLFSLSSMGDDLEAFITQQKTKLAQERQGLASKPSSLPPQDQVHSYYFLSHSKCISV
jgi:hypothetical protein